MQGMMLQPGRTASGSTTLTPETYLQQVHPSNSGQKEQPPDRYA